MAGAWIERFNMDILDPDVRDLIRREWSMEKKEHRRTMEHARDEESRWNTKEREWNEKINDWRQKEDDWRRKEQQWKREAERVEKEKWDREHMHLYWEDIQGEDTCVSHRTKRYSAHLANLLPGVDPLDACKSTPLTVHGVTYDSPDHCEDRRPVGGGIRGHWVDTDEPRCATFWEYFKIKDCLAPGSGLRRVESPLGGLRSGDDPEDMCNSTPGFLFGQSYSGPNAACVDWGKYGHWGIWNIPDEKCM